MSDVQVSSEILQVEFIQTQVQVAGETISAEICIPNVQMVGYSIQVEIDETGIVGKEFYDDYIRPILKKGFWKITDLNSLDGITVEGQTLDVTTLDNITGFREFIVNLKNAGELIISGFFFPGDLYGQMSMFEDMNNRKIDNYTIEFDKSIGGAWTFDAYVTNYEVGSVVGEAIHFMATLKITGKAYLGYLESGGADELYFTGVDRINAPNNVIYSPAYDKDTKDYVVKFDTDTGYAVHVTAGNHNICYWIDDVFMGYLDSDIPSQLYPIEAGIPQKVSVKMWEEDKEPKWYEFTLTRTV